MSKSKIADISKWQGDIDWKAASNELAFCILRASCGTGDDSKYLQNVKGCVENNVPFGAYHYVMTGNAAQARKEARHFVEQVKKGAKEPLFYIADIEEDVQTQEVCEGVCVAFLEELRALGCQRIGLYINRKYPWAGKAVAMCDIMWIPHWGKNDGDIPAAQYEPKYPCDLWQYTSHGAVSGINGRVDLSVPYGGRDISFFIGEGTPEEPPAEVPSPAPAQPVKPGTVVIKGNSKVYIREGNGTEYAKITLLPPGTALKWIATAENGWHAVVWKQRVVWISGDYTELRG